MEDLNFNGRPGGLLKESIGVQQVGNGGAEQK